MCLYFDFGFFFLVALSDLPGSALLDALVRSALLGRKKVQTKEPPMFVFNRFLHIQPIDLISLVMNYVNQRLLSMHPMQLDVVTVWHLSSTTFNIPQWG
jgi:hypothetical protein